MSEENIHDWMARQKFPLDRAGVEKVSAARLAEVRAVGIKFVSVLGAGGRGRDCAACRAMNGVKIEVEFAAPLPLPGCDRKHCLCAYIAEE